jgi:hypothetical protein
MVTLTKRVLGVRISANVSLSFKSNLNLPRGRCRKLFSAMATYVRRNLTRTAIKGEEEITFY